MDRQLEASVTVTGLVWVPRKRILTPSVLDPRKHQKGSGKEKGRIRQQ